MTDTVFKLAVLPDCNSKNLDIVEAWQVALMGHMPRDGAPGARTLGTIDPRAGAGMMLVFNAPLPCDVPAGEALDMAPAMHKAMPEYGALLR